MECIKIWFEKASEEALAYFTAIAILIVAVLAELTGYSNFSALLVWLTSLFMIYGLLSFLAPKIVTLWNSLLGKLSFAIITFLGTTFCLSLAEQGINYSLEVASTPFVYTQSIVALLISPLVVLIGISMLMVVLLISALPMFFFGGVKLSIKGLLTAAFKEDGSKPQEIGFLRLIALLTFITLCVTLLGKSKDYGEFVADITRWYAFNFETEMHTYCKVPEGVRVAYITSDIIITATNDEQGYSFKVTTCEKMFAQ